MYYNNYCEPVKTIPRTACSWTLLRYVTGVTERTALNIVAYRDRKANYAFQLSHSHYDYEL